VRISRALKLCGLAATTVAAVAARPTGERAASVFATLAPDSISGMRGQVKVVTLRADMASSGKALGSYTVAVTWDSTVVRLDSVAQGAEFAAPVVRYVNGGSVSLTQSNVAGKTGAFSLARFYFRIANDTIGRRSVITTTFSDFNATDFTNLLSSLSAPGGVARVVPTPVVMHFTPDSLLQRVGYKPEIDLAADLTADPEVALGSYTADVSWDNSIMVLDSVRAGVAGNPEVNVLSAGSIRLTAAGTTGGTGNAVGARLFFSYVNATYPSQTALTLSVSELHAASSFADLLPGMTVRNGKALIGGWLRGDIDLSDTITALDSQQILQAVVGLTSGGVPQGDADCNGAISAKDAQIVLNRVVGNATPFCVGTIQ
jgi:hypothetical protein